MSTTYHYLVSVDFQNATQVNSEYLQRIIDSNITITVPVNYISIDAMEDVYIAFPSALSAPEKTELDSVVNAYVYVPTPPEGKSSTYQVVVSNDVNYPGDFTTIAAAFAAGNSSVFVKHGVYYESSDIILPDGGQLWGEIPGKTIIIFTGAFSVKIDGSEGLIENTGTVTYTNNSNIITGVGTTFTNMSASLATKFVYILLGSNYYQVFSIESDTQLTLSKIYRGITSGGNMYHLQPMLSGCQIGNLSIAGSTSSGIYIRGVRYSGLQNISISQCAIGLNILETGNLTFGRFIVYASGVGVNMTNTTGLSLDTVHVANCVSHGLTISGSFTKDILFTSCASENNNGNGINCTDSADTIKIICSVFSYNNLVAIQSDSTCSNISINNSNLLKNGQGLLLNGSDSIISNSQIVGNSGNGVFISDTSSVRGCTVKDNLGNGITVNGSENRVDSNCIKNNSINGVEILALSNNNIIALNNIITNGTNLVDGGTNTVNANNILS